jgi:16S rRNA G1207 methylase RsmC
MKSETSARTAVMVLRLWMEPQHETGLRVRITQTLDAASVEQSVAVVATADDICAAVKRWVEDFTDLSSLDEDRDARPDGVS